jgi:VanZ family protein
VRLIHWRILLVVWMAAIYLVSSELFVTRFSGDATEEVFGLLNFGIRKLAHMTEFGVLVFLWFRSIEAPGGQFGSRLITSMLFTLGYAITDEIHQSYVPERLGVWTDVLWDAAGILAAGYLLRRVSRTGSEDLRRRVLGADTEPNGGAPEEG